MGFHDLLNAIHLDAHSKIRLLTESEYVFPLRITEPDSMVCMGAFLTVSYFEIS